MQGPQLSVFRVRSWLFGECRTIFNFTAEKPFLQRCVCRSYCSWRFPHWMARFMARHSINTIEQDRKVGSPHAAIVCCMLVCCVLVCCVLVCCVLVCCVSQQLSQQFPYCLFGRLSLPLPPTLTASTTDSHASHCLYHRLSRLPLPRSDSHPSHCNSVLRASREHCLSSQHFSLSRSHRLTLVDLLSMARCLTPTVSCTPSQ